MIILESGRRFYTTELNKDGKNLFIDLTKPWQRCGEEVQIPFVEMLFLLEIVIQPQIESRIILLHYGPTVTLHRRFFL